MSTSVLPTRNKPQNDNRLTSEIDNDEFATASIDLYEGPKVTIIVQAKKYSLPRRLICHSSPVFDAAFKSEFKEGQEQEMDLSDATTISAFEAAVKWMYTGKFVPPKRYAECDLLVTYYVDFFKLVDYLQLVGAFTESLTPLKEALIANRDLETGITGMSDENVQSALSFPSGNPLRELVLKACVTPYIRSVKSLSPPTLFGGNSTRPPFVHEKIFNECDRFAADLFRLVTNALRNRGATNQVHDPLDEKYTSAV